MLRQEKWQNKKYKWNLASKFFFKITTILFAAMQLAAIPVTSRVLAGKAII